jgi:hypothetical protein
MIGLIALVANVVLAGEDTEEFELEIVVPLPVGASIIVLLIENSP